MESGRKWSQFIKKSSSMKLNTVLPLSKCFLQLLICDLHTVLRSAILLWKMFFFISVGTLFGKCKLFYDFSAAERRIIKWAFPLRKIFSARALIFSFL